MCVQESQHIEQVSETQWKLKEGFVPHMRVPGYFYVNEHLRSLVFEELQAYCSRGDVGGFLPAVKQIANVAALPGIVKVRMQLHGCVFSSAACAPLTGRMHAPEIHRPA